MSNDELLRRVQEKVDRLREGEDYYWEGRHMVFTQKFHLRRGYCCGSGCRHCPYDPAYTKGNTTRKVSEASNNE